MNVKYCLVCVLLVFVPVVSSERVAAQESTSTDHASLREERRGFTTHLILKENIGESAPPPPAGDLDLVNYRSPVGELPAYVSHRPLDKEKHPAIIWVVGGFSNSISEIAWTPGKPNNDQSASVFRKAGIVMMYPSLRGGNNNPGFIENFYGEVDDLLAARDYLARQDFIDPKRIYLGGHSTGGTLVLLTAECSGDFRAVFAFGPVENPRGYGSKFLFYDLSNPKESDLRAPVKWLDCITNPTFVFEGVNSPSNIASLKVLAQSTHNPAIQFYGIPNATHFSGIRPVSKLIAGKILRDTGTPPQISFTPAEIASSVEEHPME